MREKKKGRRERIWDGNGVDEDIDLGGTDITTLIIITFFCYWKDKPWKQQKKNRFNVNIFSNRISVSVN